MFCKTSALTILVKIGIDRCHKNLGGLNEVVTPMHNKASKSRLWVNTL